MKDPYLAYRKSIYDAINGQIMSDGSPVMVWDEKAEDETNDRYILLSQQTSIPIPNFSGFFANVSLVLQIIVKTQDTVSKDILDDISDQVVNILLLTPMKDGLIQQPGFQINCVTVSSMNSVDLSLNNTQSVLKKLLGVSAKIAQS